MSYLSIYLSISNIYIYLSIHPSRYLSIHLPSISTPFDVVKTRCVKP